MLPWLADAALDWLVIAAAVAMIQLWPHVYTVLAGILIIGNRQHALAILGHDGTHYTLSRNAALNDFLTNLFCFWPLGLTVSGYRALHYAHHKNTGMENDPELGHKRMRSPQWDLPATPVDCPALRAEGPDRLFRRRLHHHRPVLEAAERNANICRSPSSTSPPSRVCWR